MLEFVHLSQQEPLLTTHDCVYLKQKLSSNQIVDITHKLNQTFQYLHFEYEHIEPTKILAPCNKKAHQTHIRREEKMALDKEAGRLSTTVQQNDELGISIKIK